VGERLRNLTELGEGFCHVMKLLGKAKAEILVYKWILFQKVLKERLCEELCVINNESDA